MARSPMASSRKSLEATLAASTQAGRRWGPSTISYPNSGFDHCEIASLCALLCSAALLILVCAPSPLSSAAQRNAAQRSAARACQGVSVRGGQLRWRRARMRRYACMRRPLEHALHTSALHAAQVCLGCGRRRWGSACSGDRAIGRSGDRAIGRSPHREAHPERARQQGARGRKP